MLLPPLCLGRRHTIIEIEIFWILLVFVFLDTFIVSQITSLLSKNKKNEKRLIFQPKVQ